MMRSETLENNLFVKRIDYATEEYVKQLVRNCVPDRQDSQVDAFIGIVRYPSDQFLNDSFVYTVSRQFINYVYVGYMEFLLPPVQATADVGTGYTMLSFKLDGVTRQFMQVSQYGTTSQGISFGDWLVQQYPNTSEPFAFNRDAIHYITDINVTGGFYEAQESGAPFVLSSVNDGVAVPGLEFEIAISGWRCLAL